PLPHPRAPRLRDDGALRRGGLSPPEAGAVRYLVGGAVERRGPRTAGRSRPPPAPSAPGLARDPATERRQDGFPGRLHEDFRPARPRRDLDRRRGVPAGVAGGVGVAERDLVVG